MEIRELRDDDWARFGPRIAAMERDVAYPLGDDWFRIDHGADYFAFFRRLGRLVYLVALEGDRPAGVFAAVERRHPRCWYACDLKVNAGTAQRFLGSRLGRRFLAHHFSAGDRGYGISMNPAAGDNRVVRMLSSRRGFEVEVGPTLLLFSLDHDAMTAAAPVVERHRGPLGYLSLSGVKDIVLRSTGAPIDLLHVQFGPCRDPTARAIPRAGAVHMLCAPESDALAASLRSLGHEPSASATVIHRDMADADWSFVLTSDI